MSCSTAACPTCCEEKKSWLTSVRSIVFRSSPRTPRNSTSPATTASSAAATRPTLGRPTSRAARPPDQNKFGVDLGKAAAGGDGRLVRAVDVQHRPPERQRRSYRHQAGQGLRREFRARLGPRRAHGRDELFAAAQHPAAAAHRSDGLALRPDAADQLGRRARSRRARDRRGHQRHGRGRPVRLGLRSWRRRRRLREHLGHRQALFRGDEGQEHPHPQPAGLQFRSPCHARHGRRRTEQLLRGCGARRHHRRGRHQRARNPDQLFPEPLGAESARHLDGQEEGRVRLGTGRARPHRHRRSAPHGHRQCLRGRGRQGQRHASRASTPAPISRCSTPG